MRTLRRRLLPLALVSAAAFSISYAVAQAGDEDPAPRGAAVPGVTPRPVSEEAPPKVNALGPAAPLPGLRRPRRVAAPAPAPAATPAPRRRVTPAPAPTRVTPTPAPVTPAPRSVTPTPAPAPKPKPKTPAKEFKSIG